MKLKYLFSLLVLFAPYFLISQITLSQYSLGTANGDISSSSNSVFYSIGGIGGQSISTNDLTLTTGFPHCIECRDCSDITNVSSYIVLKEYRIFPNPVVSRLQIDIPDVQGAVLKYRILNYQGVLLSEGMINRSDIDVSSLVSGFYFIEILDTKNELIGRASFVKTEE